LFFFPPHGRGIIRDLLSVNHHLRLCTLPNSALPINLLCSKHAAVHNVHNTTSHVELPVTVSFLNQEFMTQLPFQNFHDDVGFEVIFGSQWESWCILNKGQLDNLFLVFLLSHFSVPCPLLAIDVPPHIYHDISSIDAKHNVSISSSSVRSDDPCLPSSSRLSDPPPESLPTTAHAILEDMFLSHHLSGIRVSVFHASEHHLQKVCLLHGLDVNTCTDVRDIRSRLLFHVVNGDCFMRL